jgi:TRAP-type C4-dicarboxylate transport system permease small subunit
LAKDDDGKKEDAGLGAPPAAAEEAGAEAEAEDAPAAAKSAGTATAAGPAKAAAPDDEAPSSSDDAPPKSDAPAAAEDAGDVPPEDAATVQDAARLSEADEHPAMAQAAAGAPKRGAAWGEPIAAVERKWTALDAKLITGVLVAQLLVLVAWVFLAGLSSPTTSGTKAGWAFRAVAGAVALGCAAWFGAKKRPEKQRLGATLAAIVVGIAIAPVWRNLGVEYFDNVKGWLQEGSTLTLMGGLRGVATRLTLWLALLGASLATAMGKHIHVDVIFRFLPVRLRVPAAVVNFGATAVVCMAAAWGFFDHIAVQSFGARLEDTAGAKVAKSVHALGEHAFLTRKQISLDLRTLPRVIGGAPYDRWMSANQWNEWVKGAGFSSRYPQEQVDGLLVPEDSLSHAPLVIDPGGESTRGMLVHALNLVFPFGLLVIALRFLLRILLAISGHIDLDPNAAHQSEPSHSPGGGDPLPVEEAR